MLSRNEEMATRASSPSNVGIFYPQIPLFSNVCSVRMARKNHHTAVQLGSSSFHTDLVVLSHTQGTYFLSDLHLVIAFETQKFAGPRRTQYQRHSLPVRQPCGASNRIIYCLRERMDEHSIWAR